MTQSSRTHHEPTEHPRAPEPKALPLDRLRDYRQARFWWLREMMRVAVQIEMGSVSGPNGRKERKVIQKEMLALRHGLK